MTKTDLVFYGVRGSYPVSHKSIHKYGGNTSSILIDREDGSAIILDAGTGIINIGRYLVTQKPHIKKIVLFLTHLHLDHIQGISFFEPLFDEDYQIDIYCDDQGTDGYVRDAIFLMFNQPLSPIRHQAIKANIRFLPLDVVDPHAIVIDNDIHVDYIKKKNAHPLSGVLIYKLKVGEFRLVYSTDVEWTDGLPERYRQFVDGSDILIHDSQYFDEEYYTEENSKKGFGHSTVSMAVTNALQCRVNQLYLFHYSPNHSDADVEQMLNIARGTFENTHLAEELKKISLRR